jgi:hypothetical protein
MSHTNTRLYDPVGSVTFHEFANIIDYLMEGIENSIQPVEVKKAKLETLASVRSHVSSAVETSSDQDGPSGEADMSYETQQYARVRSTLSSL